MRLVVVALLLAASFLPFDTPVAAAESVTMSVRPGFDGLVRVGTWLPVEIEVANRGQDISGELDVQVEGSASQGSLSTPAVTHSSTAVLPRYSDKRFVLNVFVPTVANHVTARLIANGDVLAQRDVPLETVPSGELLCGVLSRNSTALDFLPTVPLSAKQRNVRLAHLDLSDIPVSSHVFSSLDCLIMGNLAGGALSDQQMGALQGWVSAGGLLVVTGGQSWQRTVSNLPPELLPVTISGTAPTQSLASLAGFAQQKLEDQGPWLVSQATVTNGTVIVKEGETPLLVAGRRGAGAVFYLALDPTGEPLRSWTGSEYLWRYILSNASVAAASPSVASRQYSGWGRTPRQALSDISGAGLPSGRPLAMLMLGYGMVLAPVSYLGLRRLRRPGLTSMVTTVVIIATVASSFALADANRDADVIVNKITVVRAWDATSLAQIHTYVSIFSPKGSRYDIVTPQNTLLQSLYYPVQRDSSNDQSSWSLNVLEGKSPTVRGFELPQGAMGSLVADAEMSAIPVTGEISVQGRHLTGTVTNRSNKLLQDADIVVGREVAHLGALAPGQARAVEFDLTADTSVGYMDVNSVVQDLLSSDTTHESSDDTTKRDIVDGILNANYGYYARTDLSAVSVVAWLTEDPQSLTVKGAKTTDLQRTLLVATLPVRIAPGEQSSIPPELIERRPMSVTVGSKMQGDSVTLAPGDSASTEFMLPVQPGQFEVKHLALNVEGSIGGKSDAAAAQALGTAAVFDWQKADWTEIPLSFGQNDLPDPQRFVSPLGSVRVRYTFRPTGSSDPSKFEVTKFDISVGGVAR